jgi:uncharacterized oxidoreductase
MGMTLAEDQADWAVRQQEIDVLLSGPVHLNHLLIPLLLEKENSLIVNVTSGGAYIPQVFAPIYSACKAALQSYTLTFRHALSQTNCRVVELIPPAVQTALAGAHAHGANLDEFCDTVFDQLVNSTSENIGFGPTANLSVEVSGRPVEQLFTDSAARFPVKLYQQ